MEFNDYTTIQSELNRMVQMDHEDAVLCDDSGKQLSSVEAFYDQIIQIARSGNQIFAVRHAMLERDWTLCGKPFYKVWPAVLPMIERLRFDMLCDMVPTSDQCILLRLPKEGNTLQEGDIVVRSVMFGRQPVAKEVGAKELVDGIAIMIDTGERNPQDGSKSYTFKVFPLLEGQTVDYAVNRLPYDESFNGGDEIPKTLVNRCIRLVLTVLMIGDDPELITPEILSKDRAAFNIANEARRKVIVERARRRGKHGFHLGARLSMSPHYRNAHFAKLRVGKGRTQIRLTLRKGSIVKRKKLTSIPTGYDGKDLQNT